ncbi:Telomere repeat-binding protein 4 [Raphanus sativus]|uniref:Telomere repeat-binding protein 4 isoform X2 n=1 Tax=Raphanus sativus TaxID=3726 RepID=A0A9W3DCB3_RAPSA|nr:telomere repeat-binding protein 4 isoform X2 [Raphanus sativus]KAJ4908420.1 Telomere repeat-binding protein 4 [Raphanus sativus]
MVVKRRLNCGGFDFSSIPKAPRSTRRKVSTTERDDDVDSHITAFDLLASLAGKLLEESESSSSTSSTYGGDDSQEDHLLAGKMIKLEQVEDVYNNNKLASKSPSEITSETSLRIPSDCVLEQTPVSDCKRALDLKPLESGGITEETGVVNVGAGFEQGEATNGLMITDTISLKDPSHESVHRDGSKLVCRDDDENYCKYYKFSDKSYRPMTRVGHRRITKKSMVIKYGRAVVPRSKCFKDTRTDGCLKALYRKRKLCYGYNQWKHESVRRKRRLCDKGWVVYSDGGGGLSSESVTNSPVKGESVKLSIKSFRIPELFIEVPGTATVGSLKRTVMEAVTALLGDGIRIGVLVQGKKVRDDKSTLSQTGLSCRENLDNLGFTLEPGSSENPVISMPTDSTNLSERSAASSPALDSRSPFLLQDAHHVINIGTCVENSQELVPYQIDITADERQQQPSSDSRAIVPVPPMEPDALAIVPLKEKPKRTELSQRRTRRPFSVTEVESLVHAVEELGTGRWRDVKLRSFGDASHRTYVDLKDKWKTLVHTASISPQQRRGEPVPQELLDRVLAAHRHWSQHQVKQNGKHQAAATMVVESGAFM